MSGAVMGRNEIATWLGLLALLFTMTGAQAQQALVPDRRISLMPDTDLPSGDLGPIFDTTFDACLQGCVTDDDC
ncbi:MAG: hypothetical protein L0G27_00685, partial [Paracoccus sp. (in: a-proteobacteria)]|nr:hypothetical protein [Paracoccus sp. (in: a-proteobacteria)]